MSNKDVAVEAVLCLLLWHVCMVRCVANCVVQVTGSGKTLAFVIPVVEALIARYFKAVFVYICFQYFLD